VDRCHNQFDSPLPEANAAGEARAKNRMKGQTPEQVMNTFKSYASRTLNGTALDAPKRQRWSRHGSTRHLWTTESVSTAIHYVVCEQGEPMAFFQGRVG
jgi:hypothetical protein